MLLADNQPFALDFGFQTSREDVSGSAQSYVVSCLRDKKAGLIEPSLETLDAKGETVRRVKDTLAICGDNVPPSIIFAVSLLACGCVSASRLFVLFSIRLTGRRLLIQNGMQLRAIWRL
jgi:hypothetical protein